MQFTAAIDAFPTEKWDQIIALNLSAAKHGLTGLTKAAELETAGNRYYMQCNLSQLDTYPLSSKSKLKSARCNSISAFF